jgi:hypothetical protein
MNAWWMTSIAAMLVGGIVAKARGSTRWSAWGYQDFHPDLFGLFLHFAGLLSLIMWGVAAIAIKTHGGEP